MIRKTGLFLALALVATSLLPVSAQAAISSTSSVAMSFTEADGATPMANATVGVFYMSPSQAASADGTAITLTRLGTGTTNSAGAFSATLSTSAIAASDLGDVGDGAPDAYNAVIEALDPAGNFAVDYEVLSVGSAFSGAASVNYPAAPNSPQLVTTAMSGQAVVLAHDYRFTPVTPLNSGYGMEAVLNYTSSTSTHKQTEVQAAEATNSGGFTVGGYQLEDTDRGTAAPWKVDGGYHTWLWADYEYKEYRICAQNCGGSTAVVWKPYFFTGNLTPDNTNQQNGATIGQEAYSIPTFTPGGSNQNWFKLTQNNSGWSRSNGTRDANDVGGSFTFPFAGSVTVDSLTTYGTITSVTYNWISSASCGSGKSRVIWGQNNTPSQTPRLQADCFNNSGL